jgi:hypothetical protein
MTEVTPDQLKYMELYAVALARIAELELEVECLKLMLEAKSC